MIFPKDIGGGRPNPTQMALSGLGTVRQYGLPAGRPRNQTSMEIAYPLRILNTALEGATTGFSGPFDDSFFQAQSPGPTSVFGDCTTPGPAWNLIFDKGLNRTKNWLGNSVTLQDVKTQIHYCPCLQSEIQFSLGQVDLSVTVSDIRMSLCRQSWNKPHRTRLKAL